MNHTNNRYQSARNETSRKYQPVVSRDKSIMDNLSDLVMLATVFENRDALQKILDNASEPLFTVVSLTLAMRKQNSDIIELLLTHPKSKYESYSICATMCVQRLQRLYQVVDVLEQIDYITKNKENSDELTGFLNHNNDSDSDEYLEIDGFSTDKSEDESNDDEDTNDDEDVNDNEEESNEDESNDYI